ncbi:MAG: metal-dependent hydrolase [Pseudomonadales bacterium]|nr:metal-dependent hydrolase [Pseudomonadales bacterium]
MDPITQAVLGAAAPQLVSKPKLLAKAGIMGAAAGMSADLDVIIRSPFDSLLFLEYHRHFTHSFAFIPFGALICALVLHRFLGVRWEFSFRQSYLYCFLGYATHGLTDACTTYGTMLFWPFNNIRVAWNTVSVVDPAYTIPLLTAVLITAIKKKPWIIRTALIWIFLYPALGLYQSNKAEDFAKQSITQSTAQPQSTTQPSSLSDKALLSLSAKPSFGNIVLWKIIYETDTHFYVDAVRVGLFQQRDEWQYFKGEKIEKLDIARDFSWLDPDSQQAKDIERFRWFSNGYIAKDPEHQYRIVDIRYSMIPNQIKALWSITLNPNASPDEHATYDSHRDSSKETRDTFYKMLF